MMKSPIFHMQSGFFLFGLRIIRQVFFSRSGLKANLLLLTTSFVYMLFVKFLVTATVNNFFPGRSYSIFLSADKQNNLNFWLCLQHLDPAGTSHVQLFLGESFVKVVINYSSQENSVVRGIKISVALPNDNSN